MLQDVQALAQLPFVADVPLAEVARLAEALEVVELPAGEPLIREGDTDEALYLVLDGDVGVTSSASGRERVLWTRRAGEIVGSLSLVDNAPRFMTARPRVGVRAARLTRDRYKALTAGDGPLALALQRAIALDLARQYRALAEQIRAIVLRGAAVAPPASDAAPSPDAGSAVDTDVAVIGGGPLGMIYAQWIKRWRPETRVTVLERREVPGYKIGESTLSTTVRCLRALGFTMPQLRRLFGNKAGLRFWWAGPASPRPEMHVDVIDIEETFQLERRVFEMALQRLTREQGVEFRAGAQVEVDDSVLVGPVKTLACVEGNRAYPLRARIVCDATGPAALLPRHFGTYRKDPSLHDSFQTNSYFGYFRQRLDVPVAHWQEAATRHLCFPEGWVWFITVHSWEQTDDEAARRLVDAVMSETSPDDAQVPPRRELAKRHGADFELITSIGITVRDDRDTAANLPVQQRFQHYVDKYPALAFLLSHYEVVEQPYREKRRPYAAFLGLAHDSTEVAGDGWLAIGDSAQFTNPLFSHGLNYGTGTAYMAARDTVAALESGDVGKAAFVRYEQYCRDTYPVLLQETDFYYRSWAHPAAFERTLLAKFFFAALDVTQREGYSDTDPYVFDPLNPQWTGLLDRVRDIEKRFEAEDGDPTDLAARIAPVTDEFLSHCAARAAELGLDMGTLLSDHDGRGNRIPDREKPRGEFRAYSCPECRLWQDDTLARCPICGTENPAPYVPAGTRGRVATGGSEALGESARERRRRYREVRVAEVIEETPDARTFVFEISAADVDDFSYAPGQFLTVQLESNGERLKRCYSLSSAPSLDRAPAVTVKRIPGGRASNWLLDRVRPGSVLRVLPPDGRFVLSPGDDDIFLFAAGSGITPIYSILREALAESSRKVRLVYVNRSREATIFRRALSDLKERYGRRLKLVYRIGSREGRVDARDVQAYCDAVTDGQFLVCGPWGFMDVVEEGLLDMGVDPDRVHLERFASPGGAVSPAPPAEEEADRPAEVSIDLFGEVAVVPCRRGQPITEAALAAGLDVPVSCEDGVCGTCRARLVEGEVALASVAALTKGQRNRGEILACQSRPETPRVSIRFE